MYSIIFGGALCLCSAYIGFAIKKSYDNKKRFFVEWLDFASFLVQNISFLKKPVCDIISDFCAGREKKKNTQFVQLILAYKKLIDTSAPSKESIVAVVKKHCQLSESQQKNANDFFLTLGTIDKESQLNNLKLLIDYINKNIVICEKNCTTVGALAAKLGIVIGVAVMIVIA